MIFLKINNFTKSEFWIFWIIYFFKQLIKDAIKAKQNYLTEMDFKEIYTLEESMKVIDLDEEIEEGVKSLNIAKDMT